jgi:hypothetical protein
LLSSQHFRVLAFAPPIPALTRLGLGHEKYVLLFHQIAEASQYLHDPLDDLVEQRLQLLGGGRTHGMEHRHLTGGVIDAIEHEAGATACTDVTGFGLLGHLVEMTRASDADVQLKLEAVPLMDGAEQTVAAGILSSLQPQNVRLRRAVHNPETVSTHPHYPLLFDPQTAGGLLASVPAEAASACLDELHELGYPQAAIIGRVEPRTTEAAPIQVIR